jgi:hypothetical protein
VKDENGDLLADSHNILNRWKNYFSQLLNVHNVIMSSVGFEPMISVLEQAKTVHALDHIYSTNITLKLLCMVAMLSLKFN